MGTPRSAKRILLASMSLVKKVEEEDGLVLMRRRLRDREEHAGLDVKSLFHLIRVLGRRDEAQGAVGRLAHGDDRVAPVPRGRRLAP